MHAAELIVDDFLTTYNTAHLISGIGIKFPPSWTLENNSKPQEPRQEWPRKESNSVRINANTWSAEKLQKYFQAILDSEPIKNSALEINFSMKGDQLQAKSKLNLKKLDPQSIAVMRATIAAVRKLGIKNKITVALNTFLLPVLKIENLSDKEKKKLENKMPLILADNNQAYSMTKKEYEKAKSQFQRPELNEGSQELNTHLALAYSYGPHLGSKVHLRAQKEALEQLSATTIADSQVWLKVDENKTNPDFLTNYLNRQETLLAKSLDLADIKMHSTFYEDSSHEGNNDMLINFRPGDPIISEIVLSERIFGADSKK